MKQIQLQPNRRESNDVLIGKTIKNISFGLYSEKSCLIITFTDDTYIYLDVEEDTISSDSNYEMSQMKNDHAVPLTIYSCAPGYVRGGKFHYYSYIEEEIRMGIIEPDREREMQRIAEANERQREREYEQYLKLKEKFEK